ncbi:hypothetical protein ALC57_13868 [Trachymyrmex cornetzi]|uniref:Uncharacterized protein n=1 Tax=Trachymyrmex cornetzi TaxID=471704 RepID=A0A195DLM5_9HYME|nr:hypothetical protein ALC57_13868 [Trachymyrmex cornetzi]
MAPSRKIRGVEYYGHDDHEDHSLGFPSIEGTLMAISFLTFAVYLVRLVMVRNIPRDADLSTRIITNCKIALYFL